MRGNTGFLRAPTRLKTATLRLMAMVGSVVPSIWHATDLGIAQDTGVDPRPLAPAPTLPVPGRAIAPPVGRVARWVNRAVRLAAQRQIGVGLLLRARALIEQAMLLRRLPVAAKFRELVAFVTALLPGAWRRLRGLVPAKSVPAQAMQQQALATQIELAPKSPEKAPARNALKRARSTTVPASQSRPWLASALPAHIDSTRVTNPNKYLRLFQSNRYLLEPYSITKPTPVGFARTHHYSNPIVVNFGLEQVKPPSGGVPQFSSLGPYWVKHVEPILGTDGRELPVYQLKIHQYELCKNLIQSIAPGYSTTGAMVQYIDSNRIEIAIRLQRQEPLHYGLIAATSSDLAEIWDKVVLRNEKGGSPCLT